MILPTQIKGRNRIRDAQIIHMFVETDIYDQSLIAKRFSITQERVSQILKNNARIVLQAADWEKLQRLKIIKNSIDPNDKLSKRDAIDLWRKEFQEDASSKVVVTQNNFHIYAPKKELENENEIEEIIPIEEPREEN